MALGGCPHDPLGAIATPEGASVAANLFDLPSPLLCRDLRGELLDGASPPALAELRSIVAVPFACDGGRRALLSVYSRETESEPTHDDVEFASLVCSIASLTLRRQLVSA